MYCKFDSNLNKSDYRVKAGNDSYYAKRFELIRHPDKTPKMYEFCTLKNNFRCEISNF